MNQSSTEMPARWSRNTWRLLVAPYLLFLLIPILAVVFRIVPGELLQNLKQEQVLQAIRLSLFTSLSSVALSVLLGTPVAYYLSHRHYPLHRLIDSLVDLPTVLPPAVAGVALLIAFGRASLVGGWLSLIGISIPFTSLAVILAQTFIAAPLFIRAAAIGFNGVDCELRKAAALDGANRWQTFRYVMVPMSWQALLTGSVTTWARALGEFGATIIFAGNFPGRTQTMPLAIYIGFELDLNVALTLSVILIAFSLLTLFLAKGLLAERRLVNAEEVFD